MQQILIIEDDRALNQGLCKALKTDNSSIQVSSGLYAFETDRQIVSCENLKDAKEQMLCGIPDSVRHQSAGWKRIGFFTERKEGMPGLPGYITDSE